MLATNDEGLLEAASLPAKSDPMFARVEDMRVRHHAFIDTVDEYYGALHDEMLQAYIMWRRHSYDQQEQLVSRKQEPNSQDFFSSSSGYLTMTQRYNDSAGARSTDRSFRSWLPDSTRNWHQPSSN